MKTLCRCAFLVFVLSGCMTLEQAAPPVGLLGVGQQGSEHGKLALGRDIYITRCAKCHAVEPVTKYPLAHWQEVIDEMAGKTHLNANETQAVLAYVTQVIKVSHPSS